MGFENFSAENIASHITKSWEDRLKIRKELDSRIPRMKKEADRAAELTAALYRGESVEKIINKYKNEHIQKVA